MNEKTNRSATAPTAYFYLDNWGGDYHEFNTLDEAKRHAIDNNMGMICIRRRPDSIQVCIVEGDRYFA